MTGRRQLLRGVAAWATVPTLAGCTVLENRAPRFEFFVIEDLGSAREPQAARGERTLLLTMGTTAALYDSDRMVYTRDGASRAYYQYANWSERPARRLLTLIETRLTSAGTFGTVARSTSGVRGDWVMSLRLDELLHDASTAPQTLRLGLTVELLDWRSRTLTGRQSFTRTETVERQAAVGAAQAANRAATAVLDALSTWIAAQAARAPEATGSSPGIDSRRLR
jgi:cholesterol transport system auxiliary component